MRPVCVFIVTEVRLVADPVVRATILVKSVRSASAGIKRFGTITPAWASSSIAIVSSSNVDKDVRLALARAIVFPIASFKASA